MKRQINIQQVKEHDKCPPTQANEEEIGGLPEKEFIIMIVNMIQNQTNKNRNYAIYTYTHTNKIKTLQRKENKRVTQQTKETKNDINQLKTDSVNSRSW